MSRGSWAKRGLSRGMTTATAAALTLW